MKSIFCILLTVYFCTQLSAVPKLKYVSPAGGQTGTEQEVTLSGDGLDSVKDIVFYEKGLKLIKIIAQEKKKLKVLLKIEKECRLGSHLIRLFGKDQFSNTAVFAVGQYPSKTEKEDNGSFEQAEEILINHTIEGIIKREDIDYFKVSLKKGQRLNIEAEANRLAYGFMDLHLSIYDQNKFLVKDNDDTILLRQDPYISYKTPKEGIYYIAIRSSEYDGHGSARYRMHVGNHLRPHAIFPSGGVPGKTTEINFILDNGAIHKEKLIIPLKGNLLKVYATKNGLKTPSFIPFQISKLKAILETQPNNEKKDIKEIHPYPVVFDGIIEEKGDIDWFAFTAEKGKNLSVKVDARSLRSPLDSLLEVYTAKGKLIKRQDDSPGPDSIINFKTPEKGVYYIRIHDHLKNGAPFYTYRISVDKKPAFVNMELPSKSDRREEDQALTIAKGAKKFRHFQINRSGTKGKDQIVFNDLPAGVTAKVLKYSDNSGSVPVLFTASQDCSATHFKVLPQISNDSGLKGKFQQTINMNYGQNNRYFYRRTVDKLTIGIGEKPPFKLRVVNNTLPLPHYGYHDITIHIDREKGFTGEVRVKLTHKQNGLSAIDQIKATKDQKSINYRISAASSAPLGEWPLVFVATASHKGLSYEVASSEYNVKIIPQFIQAKLNIVSFKQGEEAPLQLTLNHMNPFDGKAKAKLFGLVNGVTANEVFFDKTAKTISFNLKVDKKTKLGQHKNMYISIEIPWDGKFLPQNLSTGGVLRVDPPVRKTQKPKTVAKKAPKPTKKIVKKLSRLEELRLLKEQRNAQK